MQKIKFKKAPWTKPYSYEFKLTNGLDGIAYQRKHDKKWFAEIYQGKLVIDEISSMKLGDIKQKVNEKYGEKA